ncbi:diacylglycerol/lipid kinase family protein [Haloarcula marina]|uniref:diacylglycerol/lipid kinase family protein n=1 Tax=Haloarcula marina TaxID=2961574 RepID=UPI0020B87A9A|nr:YegS/Rv2252/BmrU family lipid kinase [Halomicroarcula marina]
MYVEVAIKHTRSGIVFVLNPPGYRTTHSVLFPVGLCSSPITGVPMASPTRIVVRNPKSGDGKRTQRAKTLATDRGWEVLDSDGGDHTAELAASAAHRADTVIACGGDGTLNKTVKGVQNAGKLDAVSLGVLPAGTGNDFADNIGIRGIDHGFDVIESGEYRQLDLGMVNDRPFLNSCVGGLTAESSAKTSAPLKRRLGVLAYVLTTLSVARDFESLSLWVSIGPERDPVWTGEALMLLIGNGRRFPGEQMRQANMEDGLVNVVIIEDAPTLDYLSQGAADKLFRRKASHLIRVKTSHLHVTHDGGPVQFSLDGEMIETDELTVDSRPGAMEFAVGPDYDPAPEEWSDTTPQ